jgi:hypothetical protein
MTPDALSRLTSLASADTLGRGIEVVTPRVPAEILASDLATAGFRRLDHWDTDTTRTYRVEGQALRRVTYADFCGEVRHGVLRILQDAEAQASGGALRRIAATRTGLVQDERGARTWLRRAVEVVRDRLPDLSEQQQAELEDTTPPGPSSSMPLAERRVTAATSRAAARAAMEDDLRIVLSRWLPTLPDGAHPLPDVWEAFDHARSRSGARLDEYPGIQLAGRNAFYRIAAEVADVRSIGGHRRVLEVPYELRVRSLIRRRQLVAALRLQQGR